MKRILEIRAAEGGDDSKLFVRDLAQAYQTLFAKLGWIATQIDVRPGELHLAVEGKDLSGLYNEPGGHRIQRVPPTERKGRVHTSTVTVAVIDPTVVKPTYSDSDFKIEWYSGTGAGGQNRNKVQASCRLTYIPLGIVQTAQTRSRTNSYEMAYKKLIEQLDSLHQAHHLSGTSTIRKEQVGSGMRGDKVRTIRFQDNTVVDHVTGKKMPANKYMKGGMIDLWP